jgi:hypothetical protein
MINQDIVTILSVVLFSVVFSHVIFLYRLHKTKKILNDLVKNFFILKQELIKANELNKVDEENIHKENFIKFLSSSRDSAYEYIEEVQQGLNKFVDEIKNEINYFDEFGVIDSAHPSYFSMKKISKAYKELKTLLPEEKELK